MAQPISDSAVSRDMLELTGWGRFPRSRGYLRPVMSSGEILAELRDRGAYSILARGAGRAYGDAALNSGQVCLDFRAYDRFLDFDPRSGLLHAEAGVTLERILNTFVPRGWFLPVTPGTKYPTLGGSLACNVHGKSHESLSHHVERIHMLLADGSTVACSRAERPDLFWATLGGMGLTGIILSAELRLLPIQSSYIRYDGCKARNLEEAFRLFEEKADASLSVAWIDCLSRGRSLGRSIMMCGEFARREELRTAAQKRNPLAVPRKPKVMVPLEFPSWTLNPLSVAAFNTMFYGKHPRRLRTIEDYDQFFYPLDSILRWNLIYGRPGLVQYQFLIPPEHGFDGMKTLLEEISASGLASFLAVLKKFGPQKEEGLIAFPGPGYFLALDFPVGNGRILKLMDRWDELVLKFGGRIYLTKDARLRRGNFEAMYPRLGEWKQVKKKYDPNGVFQSDLGRRLGLTEAL